MNFLRSLLVNSSFLEVSSWRSPFWRSLKGNSAPWLPPAPVWCHLQTYICSPPPDHWQRYWSGEILAQNLETPKLLITSLELQLQPCSTVYSNTVYSGIILCCKKINRVFFFFSSPNRFICDYASIYSKHLIVLVSEFMVVVNQMHPTVNFV